MPSFNASRKIPEKKCKEGKDIKKMSKVRITQVVTTIKKVDLRESYTLLSFLRAQLLIVLLSNALTVFLVQQSRPVESNLNGTVQQESYKSEMGVIM